MTKACNAASKRPTSSTPAQTRHAADVVRRAVRLQLPEEPHPLLGIGQRHRPAAVDLGDGGLLVALAGGLDLPDLLGKCAEFAGFEQGAQRQLDVTRLAGARDDLRGQQRMAAEGEKIIAQADPWQAQHFAPDRRNLLLQWALGFNVFAGCTPARQRTAVQLAARLRGMASRRIRCAGTMYSGNPAARAALTVWASSAAVAV